MSWRAFFGLGRLDATDCGMHNSPIKVEIS